MLAYYYMYWVSLDYVAFHFILATICTLCEVPESNTIDSGAIQINCIIIIIISHILLLAVIIVQYYILFLLYLLMPFLFAGSIGTPPFSVRGHPLHLSPGVSHLLCFFFRVSLPGASWPTSSRLPWGVPFYSHATYLLILRYYRSR